MTTHDWETKIVQPSELDNTCVLVGECGGLSAIVGDCKPSSVMDGMYYIETEHGTIYVDAELDMEILNLS